MKKVSPSEVKNDLSVYLRKLEHDTQFLKSIDKARSDIRSGKGTRLEDLADQSNAS